MSPRSRPDQRCPTADAGDMFGRRVALSAGTVLVSAMREASGSRGVHGNQVYNSAASLGLAVEVQVGLSDFRTPPLGDKLSNGVWMSIGN